MNIFKTTNAKFKEQFNQIMLVEILDNKSKSRIRKIQQFAGDVSPEKLVSDWNKSLDYDFKLIGIMKEGEKIIHNKKEYTFTGIGQFGCPANTPPKSMHLRLIDKENNQHALELNNKYLTSSFFSMFLLNKAGLSLKPLQKIESPKKEVSDVLTLLLSKFKKDSVFALHSLLQEKKYSPEGSLSLDVLLKKEMNVINLHNLGDSIHKSKVTLNEAFSLAKDIEITQSKHTKNNHTNKCKIGIK